MLRYGLSFGVIVAALFVLWLTVSGKADQWAVKATAAVKAINAGPSGAPGSSANPTGLPISAVPTTVPTLAASLADVWGSQSQFLMPSLGMASLGSGTKVA